jgi:site-specific DNA-adenine methylase
VKTLPTFCGGKARWTKHLSQFKGKKMVEPFAGSAAISFALASEALWNELDPALVLILSRFDEQIVPDVFTQADYYTVRAQPDWWKHAFCLQKMSFGGLFRHSKGKFNVPPDKRINEVHLRPQYEEALARWKELKPHVTQGDWANVPPAEYADAVVILDPPFKNSHTPYNNVENYRVYWQAVDKIVDIAETVIAFEYEDVLERFYPDHELVTRVSRFSGKHPARTEAMVVLTNDR